jgi:hypothetical protein
MGFKEFLSILMFVRHWKPLAQVRKLLGVRAEGPISAKSRGDWTPLELFVAGTRALMWQLSSGDRPRAGWGSRAAAIRRALGSRHYIDWNGVGSAVPLDESVDVPYATSGGVSSHPPPPTLCTANLDCESRLLASYSHDFLHGEGRLARHLGE